MRTPQIRHQSAQLLASIVCLLMPASPAAAQQKGTAPAQSTMMARDSRVDVAVSIGDWFRLDPKDFPVPGFRPEFFGALAWQISGGYYWNEHLKSEVEVGWTGTKRYKYDEEPTCANRTAILYVQGSPKGIFCPGAATYSLSHYYKFSRTSVAQIYQFRRSARFHPYVGAGAGFDVESKRDGRIQTVPDGTGYNDIEVPPIAPMDTTTVVHTFAKVGFKANKWERAFFITELKIGRHVGRTLKLGVGVDF